MGLRVTLTNSIGWRRVDNAVNEKMIHGSLVHTLKSTKKIKRRTRALNIELKRFASLKTYSQYVRAKTTILRNITDNEDTDEDTDMYSGKMEFSRDSSVSPSSLPTNYLSIGTSNLDFTHDTNLDHSLKKQKTSKIDKVESNVSEKSVTRNCKENKQRSIKEKDGALTKNRPALSRKECLTQENGLINVKRNLTLLLENLDDTDRDFTSISPIAQSTQIDNEDSKEDGYNNIESCKEVNECTRNTDLQDSEEHRNFQEDSIVNDNTASITDKISDDGSVKTDEKQIQLQDQPVLDEALMKKSQPVITCNEIVKEKYTIVRDEGETDTADADTCLVESFALEKSEFSPENKYAMDDESSQANELSPESRRINQLKRINLISNSSESEQDDDQVDADEKNFVLTGSNRIDESIESHAEIVGSQTLPLPSSSQIISDPSDSDESYANPDINNSLEELTGRWNNDRSSLFSTFSDKEVSTATATRSERSSVDEKSLQNTAGDSLSKSIKCQIREQDCCESSTALEEMEEAETKEKTKKKKKKKKKKEMSNSESLTNASSTSNDKIYDRKEEDQDSGNVRAANDVPRKTKYVLKNLARVDGVSEREMKNSTTLDEDKKEEKDVEGEGGDGAHDHSGQRVDEISSRPIELCEFIEREGLVAIQEKPSITAKDFKECAQQNSDEKIWLMEIPRSIMDGDELCGKNMTFEGGKLTIDETTYNTTCRDEKSVSCILRSGRKKARYKIVNMEPVSCIIACQESSEKTASSAASLQTILPLAQTDSDAVWQSCGNVPFPKNLKSRDPLLPFTALSSVKDFSMMKDTPESLDLKETRKRKRNFNKSSKRRRIVKKSIEKLWRVDKCSLDKQEVTRCER